jgi:hypothetical protein
VCVYVFYSVSDSVLEGVDVFLIPYPLRVYVSIDPLLAVFIHLMEYTGLIRVYYAHISHMQQFCSIYCVFSVILAKQITR